MKKLLALLLVAVMCISMSGCALIMNAAKMGADMATEETSTDVIFDDTPAVEEAPEEEAPVEEAPVEEAPEEEPEESTDPFAGLTFYDYDGISLYMEDGMIENDADGFTVYAYSNSAMFAGIKEDAQVFTDAGLDIADYDLAAYADIVQQGNGLEDAFAEDWAGNLSVTYNSNQDGTDFFYYATVKEGSDSFWVITFACFAEDEALYLPQFQLWAASIVAD